MALVPGIHERLLSEFKDEVCQNPGADFTPKIAALAAEFRELEKDREMSVIKTLFLNLYTLDIHSLRRDLLKVTMLGYDAVKATPSQRVALLRCLYGSASFYIQDGFSELIAMCEEIEDACKILTGSPEPGSI